MLATAPAGSHTPDMQGHSDPNRELLDAAALCRQLVPDGSVETFLADHQHELYPDELFADLCSRPDAAVPRSLRTWWPP